MYSLKKTSATYNCVVRPSQSWSFRTSTRPMAATDMTNLSVGESLTSYYAKYRPSYTAPVFETIIDFYKEKLNDFGLAVDLGCGSGQGTVPLASYFKKVVGLDVSEQQLKHAPRDIANLTFDLSPAEDLSRFDCRSVDLITVAEAVHWFDVDRFFKEVTRVLKPGGTLVVYGYEAPSLCLPEADAYTKDLYTTLTSDWPVDLLLFNEDMDIAPTFPQCRRETIFMEKNWTIDEFAGFVGTCCPPSYFETNKKENVQRDVKKKLKSLYGEDSERRIKVTFSVFMMMTHKPDDN